MSASGPWWVIAARDKGGRATVGFRIDADGNPVAIWLIHGMMPYPAQAEAVREWIADHPETFDLARRCAALAMQGPPAPRSIGGAAA